MNKLYHPSKKERESTEVERRYRGIVEEFEKKGKKEMDEAEKRYRRIQEELKPFIKKKKLRISQTKGEWNYSDFDL